MTRFRMLMLTMFLLVSAVACGAEDDVFVMIHPKCSLVPDDLLHTERGTQFASAKLSQKERPYRVFCLDQAWATFVAGTTLKDLPPESTGYVLELGPTKIVPSKDVALGKFPGDVVERRIPYLNVVLHQPFKLWYVKSADAPPELLVDSTAFDFVSALKPAGAGGAWTLISNKPADLARLGLVEIYEDIETPLNHGMLAKLMTSKPLPGTADLKPPVVGAAASGAMPVYKASRTKMDMDGCTIIEVDLHNRLPVFACCYLNRHASETERNAFGQLPREASKAYDTALQTRIDLAPGEKQTAQFRIPPLALPAALITAAPIDGTVSLSKQSLRAEQKQ